MTLSQVPLLAPPEFLHPLKKQKQKKTEHFGQYHHPSAGFSYFGDSDLSEAQ